jgi:hypothetical protein
MIPEKSKGLSVKSGDSGAIIGVASLDVSKI